MGRITPCSIIFAGTPPCKQFVSSFGLKLEAGNQGSEPKDFQKLLLQIKDTPYSGPISKIMLRSMQKARYYEENLGHFGLALKDYCHFTSPIRRYPDLTIHRIIKDCEEKKVHKFQEANNVEG